MWVYEGHLGGLFALTRRLSVDDSYCEECGDYAWEIGELDTFADFLAHYADNIVISPRDRGGGYSIDHVMEAVGSVFDDELTIKDAKKIVSANKNKDKENFQ